MKDKFLLPSALVGLLQAILLFLCMDLFFLSTEPGAYSAWIHIFYEESLSLFPGAVAMVFGGVYAAPMLLFSKKRNWLWYFLCSIGFFLLFVVLFFTIAYVLPTEIPHMPTAFTDYVPGEFAGMIFGLGLLLFSFPYFIFVALAKLTVHLVFVAIWLVLLIRKRRAASL